MDLSGVRAADHVQLDETTYSSRRATGGAGPAQRQDGAVDEGRHPQQQPVVDRSAVHGQAPAIDRAPERLA